MCRAGKDGRVRICPGQKNKIKKDARNARRRLKDMTTSLNKRKARFEEKVERLNKEALAQGKSPLDEATLKEMEAKAVPLKASSITYKRHAEYAHATVKRLTEEGMATSNTFRTKTTKGGETVWMPERAKLHLEIVREELEKAKNVPLDRQAIISGGLGGAGKTTVLQTNSGIDLSQYITINQDDIKEIMAAKGMIPEVDGLTPMEASPLAHVEANHITLLITKIAVSRGMNIIHDTTMANVQITTSKINDLRAAGYTDVKAIFVDITPDTSGVRADKRHLDGHNDYLVGKGNGGRLLPKHLTELQRTDDPNFNSKNAEGFIEMDEAGCFDSWEAYDNDVHGRDPIKLKSVNKSLNAA
jgi:predicted ABC-type ATPase